MEDETTEDISSSESNYTGSFIASDDDFEDGLNWDSGDSRPAAPSPPSTPRANMSDSPAVRPRRTLRPRRGASRLTIRRPNIQSSSSQTDDTGSEATTTSEQATADTAPSPVVSALSSDSDETEVPYDPTSPYFSPSPSLFAPSPEDSRSSDSLPPFPPFPDHHEHVPHSPEYPPPSSDSSSDTEVEEFHPRSPVLDPAVDPPERVDPAEIQVMEAPEVVVIADTPPQENPPAEAEEVQVIQPDPPSVVEAPPAAPIPSADPPEVFNSSALSEGDDSSLCSICMDPLTNSGAHRVVCLKCGHIFGHSCLERWIKVGCNNGAKRCPTCNKKACLKDIRVLFLPKVVPLDTVERDRLTKEKEELSAQKKQLEMELTRCQLKCDLSIKKYKEKIATLEAKYAEALEALQSLEGSENKKINVSAVLKHYENAPAAKAKLLHSAEISKDGMCRVMAFSYITQELVASQPSGNTVFAGFGVRVMNTVDFKPTRFVFLHQKAIRDMAFHPEDRSLLLSVSLDTTAKLVDLANATTVHTFKGEGPLWSCCWELSNPHLMLVGSQLGRVRQYDRRMMDHYLNQWENKENPTPVVALASAPCAGRTPFPQGGFFSCRLKGVYAFSRHGDVYNSHDLSLEGYFTSMRYDHSTQSLITMTRPGTHCPHVKVSLNLVDIDTKGNICTPLIHSFNNGSSARIMSRLATLAVPDDTMIAAHNESCRTVSVWSSKTGNLVHSIPIKLPVIDMTSVTLYNNKCLLATLSDKTVDVYSVV